MKLVTHGATLQCSMGAAPSALTVSSARRTDGELAPLATVMDFKPMVNIAPFGMCRSPTNPQVAAATAAASGVLTPQPCVPVLTGPWAPGLRDVTVRNEAALTERSTCQCQWDGNITVLKSCVRTEAH